MKEIKLSQTGKNKGKFVTLVDDEDYEYLIQWRWVALKQRSGIYYAVRTTKNPSTVIYMHRVIMNTPHGMIVDHIDHNGLNNQKCNLRNCTPSQNQSNRRACGKSKYLGVFYDRGHIRAGITINNKNIKLGYFKTEELAARAYDKKAKEAHGEFANLNFKE